MYGLMINKYFIQVETGMVKTDVVGGPVYENNNSNDVVGRIIDYDPETGFMKIELIVDINYTVLTKIGIPISSIIFNNKA